MSQYNTSLGSLQNYIFPICSMFCSCTDSICISVCSKFR